ncbi:uncharacterized protein [Procambarus clarkii]|uniref:uncharacterized protein n=1 Tax=Procambarus clarkii TaxID=6728 RepID=UPI003743E317
MDKLRLSKALKYIPNKLRRFLLITLCFFLFFIPFSLHVWTVAPEDVRRSLLLQAIANDPLLDTATSEVYPKPAIDRTVSDGKDDILKDLPNLPPSYLEKHNPHPWSGNNKCAQYPPLFDISFNNLYWQVLQTSNGTFYLFSAFYDNRTLNKKKPSLRILGMMNRINPTVKTHCQIWYDDNNSPVISNITEYRYIWIKEWGNQKQGILQPYLMECVVPAEHRHQVPQSVSLVEKPCDKPTNNLRIINNQPQDGQKKDFAVCVKGLDFSYVDLSVRIVEWLEVLFSLGADKVFFYNLGIHPNISKILNYYEHIGRVDVKKLTLPGEQPNVRGLLHMYLKHKTLHQWQNELIPFNDCIYRNIYRYKFVLLLDIDEVIMPKTAEDWESLMEQVAPGAMTTNNYTHASYCARNVYFLDSMQDAHGHVHNIPPYLHMMQHIYRAANYTPPGHYVKCLHDPEKIVTIHNHYPFSCFAYCNSKNMPEKHVHLQHYRKECAGELGSLCIYFKNHTILDDRVLRYTEVLTKNINNTLYQLGFLKR